jgi:hypothetical protein
MTDTIIRDGGKGSEIAVAWPLDPARPLSGLWRVDDRPLRP